MQKSVLVGEWLVPSRLSGDHEGLLYMWFLDILWRNLYGHQALWVGEQAPISFPQVGPD